MNILIAIVRIICVIGGFWLVGVTLRSATRTFVVPRSVPDYLPRLIFRLLRRVYNIRLAYARTYEEIDGVMVYYAPTALLVLVVASLALIQIGYTLVYFGVIGDNLVHAFMLSGSSLLTLGFASVDSPWLALVAFSEAAIGIVMTALLISYLPSMYSSFQRREMAVNMLEVRAGSPPSAIEMLLRYQRIGSTDRLYDLWVQWEQWFADIAESHTSLSALTFFRSSQPHHSWVTAAGAVMDAAALSISASALPPEPQAALCLRAGYVALRRICDFFGIVYPVYTDNAADAVIAIRREEFDAACDALAAGGVPLKPDRDQAWRDFVGWRANYDIILLALCTLTIAPIAPWSSDRAPHSIRLPFSVSGKSSRVQDRPRAQTEATSAADRR